MEILVKDPVKLEKKNGWDGGENTLKALIKK